MSILTAEYDYDTAIAVKQEEAYASGREEGISLGLYQKALETAQAFLACGDSPEKVARCTGLPLERVQELSKN